jgi:hypothetical protein
LSTDTGLDKKTIIGCLNALVNKRLIAICKDSGRANTYTLIGVANREHTSTKNGTTKNGTSTENGTGTSTKNGTGKAESSTKNGTSAEIGTSTKNGTRTSTKNGTTPVPKTVPESKRESKREPNKKSFRCVGENADSAATAPLVYELPLRSKADEIPKTYAVTKEIFTCWQEAYPLVDCRAELPKIKAWLVSNPAKRPASDMPRFVNSWLKREQNNAASAEAKARASPPDSRPVATTQHQRDRQNQEDLALAVLQADREKENGNGFVHQTRIGQTVNALPPASDSG